MDLCLQVPYSLNILITLHSAHKLYCRESLTVHITVCIQFLLRSVYELQYHKNNILWQAAHYEKCI